MGIHSPDSSPTCLVDLEPVGRRVEVKQGTSLLAAAQSAGVELVALCGGRGTCQGCRVRTERGELSAVTEAERRAFTQAQLGAGFRLACAALVRSDLTVDIPPESLTTAQRLQIEGREIDIPLDPVVTPIDVELCPPSLADLRSDTVRLADAVEAVAGRPPKIPLRVLSELSNELRRLGWRARLAVRGHTVVAVLQPGERLLGLAVDIGTTKLAAYLVDLADGRTIAKEGAMNPQIGYGEDVISRIVYADRGQQQRDELQQRVAETLNRLLARLCTEAGVRREQVVEGVVVGNTAMHHLFLKLPTRQLAASPYVPAVSEALDVPAQEVGLDLAAGAHIHLPPNIAGYVGADHVAMILATGIWRTGQTALALDIGTNTEISVATNGRLCTCSCASGPAFEGAHIRDGMRAAPGAIERVRIVDGEVRVQTIGGQRPVGICGSGILDAVAEIRAAGALDESGRLQREHARVRTRDGGGYEFLLVPGTETAHGRDIIVTQKDVHEFQLAKGAIRVGIDILLEEAGLAPDSLEAFIVSGAFGTYIDVDSAMRTRMFPLLPPERFRQVGNAAGTGARQMLVSAEARRLAAGISKQIKYVELAVRPGFSHGFLQALYL